MQNEKVILQQIPVGKYENFAYLIGDPETKKVAVVDPAWDVPKIVAEVKRLGLTVDAIWLTHGHGDHTQGVEELREHYPVPVFLSPHEIPKYRPDVGVPFENMGDTMTIGNLTFDIFYTPGHAAGSVCFYCAPHLIAGDTLFIDGCGRCDLEGSDVEAMYASLHETIMSLPDETIIYPGHDYGPTPTDTLANQRRTNRFLLAKTKEAFIKERLPD
ncbi:MAG: MBL fold metallo-hydrolase [Chloroflexota bacterium]